MKINEKVLGGEEKAVFALRELYTRYGYSQYRMSKFEEYDLYARNKSFLVSDNVITFTGASGTLMALKPDVTLSIIKSTKDAPGATSKVYYNENVYRAEKNDGDFREIMQAGLECIGELDDYSLSEVVMLAAKSLETISEDFVLDVSHLGIVADALDRLELSPDGRKEVLSALSEKNLHSALSVCEREGVPKEKTELLSALITSYGEPAEVIAQIMPLLSDGKAAAEELLRVIELASEGLPAGRIRIDFSALGDMRYYNGIVMSGFVCGAPESVLSGGRYDNLLRKMSRKSSAIGFAIYLDRLPELVKARGEFDLDILLIYDAGAAPALVKSTAEKLMSEGNSVLAARAVPEKIKYKTMMKVGESGVFLLENNA